MKTGGALMTEPEQPRRTQEPVSANRQPSLSLCMILKDEGFFLDRCLEAVTGFVDEMILVDTGSTDNTLEICHRHSDRVFEFLWTDDFSAARNNSLEQARGDWILVLDADEVIESDDLALLRTRIANTDADVFLLNQLNYSNEPIERDWQPVVGDHPLGWDYAGYRVNPIARLFRNRADIRYVGKVHEIIDLENDGLRAVSLEVSLHHDINGNPEKDKAQRQRNYLRIMEEALRLSPDGRLAAQAGAVCMYHLQDYPRAVTHLRQAVQLGYERDRNREALAEAWYRMGENAMALTAYGELHESGYATASLCNNYSNLLVKAGNYGGAIEVLERALALGQQAPERIVRIQHNIAYLQDKPKAST
jgi:glycosyltransferase involved in cell wall biosynthesis